MSALTIHLIDALDATLEERMRALGAHSKEEYLVRLVESDCAAGTLQEKLMQRMPGPFALLEPDWLERVRSAAAKRASVRLERHPAVVESDLPEIYAYIASDNPEAAERVLMAIAETLEGIAAHR